MNATHGHLPGTVILDPDIFDDERGFFFESFNAKVFSSLIGKDIQFVQDNHSRSSRGVLRGLHYQIRQPQGKLVRVVSGEIFDVVVDLRRSSPTFGHWSGIRLSAENKREIWIPEGFAHGFLTLSDTADVLYKTTDYWLPEYERCIRWNDPTLKISWPHAASPTISAKDALGKNFSEAELFD